MHYKEVNDLNAVANKIDLGDKFYPSVVEMKSSNACLEEYERLKSEGYKLIGYSLFHHEHKMSQGILVQTGKKLGAHMVLFSRERSYSGSLSTSPLKSDEKFERQPFVKPLAERTDTQYISPSNNYVHNALFLVQQAMKQ